MRPPLTVAEIAAAVQRESKQDARPARGFTPAPWRWFTRRDPETSTETQETGQKMRHLIGADGQGFALTVGLSSEKDAANADLMVAAPELLAACQAIQEWEVDYRNRRLGDKYEAAIRLVDAAIKKAVQP